VDFEYFKGRLKNFKAWRCIANAKNGLQASVKALSHELAEICDGQNAQGLSIA
jgi:hypothetical protein